MDDRSRAFFQQLLETPSPSGFEQPVQALVRNWASPFADEIRTDIHGNVYATRFADGKPAIAPRILLAGHCDQIGLMVQHIDADGFVYVQPIGGWDVQILLGQKLTIWSRGGAVNGVLSRKAIHLMTTEEQNRVPQIHDLWVDAGFRSKDEAEEIIRPGDPITVELGYRPLRNNLAASPAMDDKVGLWTVLEALRMLHGRTLRAEVHSVSTVAEEIGLRGATTAAYNVEPTIGIAVDVCHATDTPGEDKKKLGVVKCGGGPVVFRGANINPRVYDRLESLAAENEIPIQTRGVARATGTDANPIQISRKGVAAALIGIPNRYMHSPVEVVDLGDLYNAARLLAAFCASVTPEDDWTP